MKIRSFANKGLKRLYLENSVKGVPPDTIEKLRNMLAFIDDMRDAAELQALKSWKAHVLTGDSKGYMEPKRDPQSPPDISDRY